MTGRSIWAEQALLGAVLSDPAGQQRVLDLVCRDDMHRPWHGQVLAAMQRLRGRGVLPGPIEVYTELKNDPDLPRSVSHDGVPVADLMAAVPRAGHAQAYAAMVIDTGIRQRLDLAGSRMVQAAGDPDADLGVAFDVVSQARRDLGAVWARWEALPEPVRRELPAPLRDEHNYAQAARRARAMRDKIGRLRADLWSQRSSRVEERLASIAHQLADVAASASQRDRQAQRRVSREARPRGPNAEAAGLNALRDLCADPSQITEVRAWLHPAHFARPEHGDLYALMQDMHEADRPVDPVTVSWEASRRGVQIDAADLADGIGALAWSNARKVHRGALLAQIEQAGRDIQAGAADPSLSPRLLLRTTAERLRGLERDPRAEPQRRPDTDAQPITTQRPPEASRSHQADWEAVR